MTGLETAVVSLDDVRQDILALQADPVARPVVEAFHEAWYTTKHTWAMATYRGVPILKNPLDLWVLQELIHYTKPALIIETGTAYGGSAYFMADVLDRVGRGAVITVDITPNPDPAVQAHPRVWIVKGSSTDDLVSGFLRERVAATKGPVLVVLDSDHHAPHVARELELYAPLVPVGGYLIVEDTNLNGRPVLPEWGPGPGEAVDAFLASDAGRGWVREPLCERFLLTMHPGGWLRRVA